MILSLNQPLVRIKFKWRYIKSIRKFLLDNNDIIVKTSNRRKSGATNGQSSKGYSGLYKASIDREVAYGVGSLGRKLRTGRLYSYSKQAEWSWSVWITYGLYGPGLSSPITQLTGEQV